jgi:predicted RNA-binding Zn ribbon-like protein
MNAAPEMILPAWYPDPDEAKPAPMPLLLVQAFVNTRDVQERTDLLDDAAAAKNWLTSAGLLPAGSPFGSPELDLARDTRESIRALVESEAGPWERKPQLGALRELAEAHHPRLTVDDRGVLGVENARDEDLADSLFGLLLIIRAAQEDGTWSRLKACANPDCQWVFYDRSRNRQGSWCEMAVCGNRLKNRKLRERRR